jgi:hypothetical protein
MEIKIVLSNEFDVYLIPEGEPEHSEYVAAVEAEIKKLYPESVIEYGSRDQIVGITDMIDPDAEREIQDKIDDIFTRIYDRFAARSAASILGKLGGSAKSERKTAAVRENGKLGGRPRRMDVSEMSFEHAVQIMAGKIDDENEYKFRLHGTGSVSHISSWQTCDAKEAAIMVITQSVEPICKSGTENIGDWIGNGSYNGDETAEDIATEWDYQF